MSRAPEADTAFRCADAIRSTVAPPWDVYGERIRRYEIHFNGRTIETIRGPIRIEGVGVRVLRPVRDELRVGFAAGSLPSEGNAHSIAEEAERTGAYATFPTASVELPDRPIDQQGDLEIRDVRLWDRPQETLEDLTHRLFEAFEGRTSVTPSFGSVRATLVESTLANSGGFAGSFSHTSLEFEIAIKAFGGPEGPPPGEFWVNRIYRKIRPESLVSQLSKWAQLAQDARTAAPTPTGNIPVLLPADCLSEILPPVIGYRFTAAARLRQSSPDPGIPYGTDDVTIADDGRFPEGVLSAPFDDEGTTTGRVPLIEHGSTQGLLYDALHASAYRESSTGSARRGGLFGPDPWIHFSHAPAPKGATILFGAGSDGSEAELIESVSDGILVEQLAWAFPDPISGNFGGELRIGHRIRAGKLAEALRGGTVGGVVLGPPGNPTLLNSIVALGSRPELHGQLYAPGCVTTGLAVAGSR
ncbi:MAG: metallopeptidase TldD-related protein [Thermoplasmata archaeon]